MNQEEKDAFIAMAKGLHKDHGCIGSESFETCTAEICVMARSVGQPNTGLQSDGGYCACEIPDQPWWGDAFMCHRCNRPRR